MSRDHLEAEVLILGTTSDSDAGTAQLSPLTYPVKPSGEVLYPPADDVRRLLTGDDDDGSPKLAIGTLIARGDVEVSLSAKQRPRSGDPMSVAPPTLQQCAVMLHLQLRLRRLRRNGLTTRRWRTLAKPRERVATSPPAAGAGSDRKGSDPSSRQFDNSRVGSET